MNKEIGRNDPCSCGSGKKFKKCCGAHAIGRHVVTLSTNHVQNSLLGRISSAGASFIKEKDSSVSDKVFQASLVPPSSKINSSSEQEKD
jgi:hypothetical protein